METRWRSVIEIRDLRKRDSAAFSSSAAVSTSNTPSSTAIARELCTRGSMASKKGENHVLPVLSSPCHMTPSRRWWSTDPITPMVSGLVQGIRFGEALAE